MLERKISSYFPAPRGPGHQLRGYSKYVSSRILHRNPNLSSGCTNLHPYAQPKIVRDEIEFPCPALSSPRISEKETLTMVILLWPMVCCFHIVERSPMQNECERTDLDCFVLGKVTREDHPSIGPASNIQATHL